MGLKQGKSALGPGLQLFRGLFPVIPGCHAESFLESAVKVRQIFVADFLRDGKNRGFGGDQQPGSHGQAVFTACSLRYSIKEVPIVFLKYFMKCDWLSPTSAEISAIVMRSI